MDLVQTAEIITLLYTASQGEPQRVKPQQPTNPTARVIVPGTGVTTALSSEPKTNVPPPVTAAVTTSPSIPGFSSPGNVNPAMNAQQASSTGDSSSVPAEADILNGQIDLLEGLPEPGEMFDWGESIGFSRLISECSQI
jgi:hypothetical protein